MVGHGQKGAALPPQTSIKWESINLAGAAVAPRVGDLPDHQRWLALADYNGSSEISSPNNAHHSYEYVARTLNARPEPIVFVCGGAKLGSTSDIPFDTLIDHLTQAIAKKFYETGVHVVTGGGPGAAMEGLPKYFVECRTNDKASKRKDLLVTYVASGLQGEQLNPYGDLVIRQPGKGIICLREQKLFSISDVTLTLPGSLGTSNETVTALTDSYLVNRSNHQYRRMPLIILDYPMNNGKRANQWVKDMLESATTQGLWKGLDVDSCLRFVDLPRPTDYMQQTWKEQLRIINSAADEIIKLVLHFAPPGSKKVITQEQIYKAWGEFADESLNFSR